MGNSNDVLIAVMGATGSGKSTFINLASNSKLLVGNGLKSCTDVVQCGTPFELKGRNVTIIDTPGFDDTVMSDADILRMISGFLAEKYENGTNLAGVIYIHRISDFRMGGISTRNFKMFRKLCGENAFKNVVIVTNMWSEVNEDTGSARERELASEAMFFKPVLDKGAQMLRHTNTPESAHAILARIVDNQPLPLQIQTETVVEKKDVGDTAAGQELNKDLEIMEEKHKKEMAALRKEMQDAIREKDEETKKELENVTRDLEAKIARLQMDRQVLVRHFGDDRKWIAEQSRAARRKNHEKQIAQLRTQYDQLGNAPSADATKAAILKQMSDLQTQFALNQVFFGDA